MNVQRLRKTIDGKVLAPGDTGYDEARRVWNARFDRRPDLIVQCRTGGDVERAVTLARERGLPISVKGGGHSYAGTSVGDGGLLVDLSLMKAIRIDAQARTVDVEAGVTCAELDQATQEHGLATPLPTVSSVGVAGAALGGGSGYLSRTHGLTLDNLLSVDLVTADGRALRASEADDTDLFWAIRGAGPNFGIATSLRLRLHRIGPQVLAGQIIYPFDKADKLLRSFRDYMAEAPDMLQCYPFMFRIPPLAAFPARFHGQPALDFVLCHLDPEAADVVQPLRALAEPILDAVGPLAYTEVQKAFDASLPRGQRYFSRGHDLEQLSDAAIDTATTHAQHMQGSFTAAYFDPGGGAIGRVDPSATPFAGRTAPYAFHVVAGWVDAADDETVMRWARTVHEAMAPMATGGVYVNVLGDDEDDRVPAAFGDNYSRLVALKTRWDPDNIFRMNHNIVP
ncbi:MAG TPA: FAD-binding oxidoreductase [Vicinamibacterales bacterium]|nr:FAD-binding oxidoreductase [Vicinamibacterales bacterium]